MTTPYLYCRCRLCKAKISFPLSSQEGKNKHLYHCPTDNWKATIQCPECAVWSLVRFESVLKAEPHTGTHNHTEYSLAFYRIEGACDQPGCEALTTVFLTTKGILPQSSIALEFAKLHRKPTCERGHRLRFVRGQETLSLFR